MRNRCIEIFILPFSKELPLFDTIKLLYSTGVSNLYLCQSMIKIHEYIQENINKNINLRYLKRWGEYLKEYIDKKKDFSTSFSISLKEVYNLNDDEIKNININEIYLNYVNTNENPFIIPSMWPDCVYVEDLINDYNNSIITLQVYYNFIIGKFISIFLFTNNSITINKFIFIIFITTIL